MKRITWFLAATVVMLLVSGAALADEPAEGRAGRAELRFLEGMIDHHQMALDMAQDCLAKAESEEVLTLCQAVIDAQSAEISTMQGWLRDWYNVDYAPVSMMPALSGEAALSGHDDMDDTMEMDHAHADATPEVMHGHDAQGEADDHGGALFTDPPMTMGMMAGLNRYAGREYEVAWLESMIDHHDDALHMSNRLLPYVQHDALLALAETIIADQTAEIAAMEALLSAYEAE